LRATQLFRFRGTARTRHTEEAKPTQLCRMGVWATFSLCVLESSQFPKTRIISLTQCY